MVYKVPYPVADPAIVVNPIFKPISHYQPIVSSRGNCCPCAQAVNTTSTTHATAPKISMQVEKVSEMRPHLHFLKIWLECYWQRPYKPMTKFPPH